MYIKNNNKNIVETDFWTIPLVRDRFFLSFNEGACRILLPTRCKKDLRDMKMGKVNVITMGECLRLGGRMGYEVLFDDHSDNPFSLTTTLGGADRRLPVTDHGKQVELSIWLPKSMSDPMTPKCVFRRKAFIRIAPALGSVAWI